MDQQFHIGYVLLANNLIARIKVMGAPYERNETINRDFAKYRCSLCTVIQIIDINLNNYYHGIGRRNIVYHVNKVVKDVHYFITLSRVFLEIQKNTLAQPNGTIKTSHNIKDPILQDGAPTTMSRSNETLKS